MRKLGRLVFVLVAVGVTGGAAINVYGDDASVRSDAEAAAFPRGNMKATSVSIERTPIAETVTYLTPEGSIHVHCSRAAILIGPYSCTRE